MAKNISATNLTSSDVPNLLQHKILNPNDKYIWYQAYDEEYDGIASLPAWAAITEQQMKNICDKYTSFLPTMVISNIK